VAVEPGGSRDPRERVRMREELRWDSRREVSLCRMPGFWLAVLVANGSSTSSSMAVRALGLGPRLAPFLARHGLILRPKTSVATSPTPCVESRFCCLASNS